MTQVRAENENYNYIRPPPAPLPPAWLLVRDEYPVAGILLCPPAPPIIRSSRSKASRISTSRSPPASSRSSCARLRGSSSCSSRCSCVSVLAITFCSRCFSTTSPLSRSARASAIGSIWAPRRSTSSRKIAICASKSNGSTFTAGSIAGSSSSLPFPPRSAVLSVGFSRSSGWASPSGLAAPDMGVLPFRPEPCAAWSDTWSISCAPSLLPL
mmetsp:Transcript_24506/g.61667  ORF Transcript_24506/g.61667 Transcript_24506/m.61667 type:complete len:212 (-) Transcript_24506:1014-1649(-)